MLIPSKPQLIRIMLSGMEVLKERKVRVLFYRCELGWKYCKAREVRVLFLLMAGWSSALGRV